MTQYKIVLCFENGREIDSIWLDKEPTEKEVREGMNLYKADSYRIDSSDTSQTPKETNAHLFVCNHTRIGKTLARDVKLNLGGGAEATVNIHLNEEGFLLVEGLGLDNFEYGIDHHDKDLIEIQILCSPDEDEE